MNREFETMMMATYADLCVQWRREITSWRSNGLEIDLRLKSIEQVMEAFGFGVPGLVVPEVPDRIAKQKPEPEASEFKPKPQPATEESAPRSRRKIPAPKSESELAEA